MERQGPRSDRQSRVAWESGITALVSGTWLSNSNREILGGFGVSALIPVSPYDHHGPSVRSS